MRALTSSDFLDLWERGTGLHPLDQGLLILGAGLPEASYEGLADLRLGRRNAALAQLRCACFGNRLQAWMACPECGEKLELDMDGRSLAETVPETQPHDEPNTVALNGHAFRLPTSRDLALAARESDPRSAAVRLLESCRLEPGESRTWSEEDLEEVGRSMAKADPLAEVLWTLNCPVCGVECNPALDIAAFLWEEIAARARRLLREVHTLARAYGWTEKEILSLSEHRRAAYLEMVVQ
jgi:hypothetical protein